MPMAFMFVKVVSAALLPPLNFLLLALLGLLLLWSNRRTGLALLAASLAGLFLLSMPVIATGLAGLLEDPPPDGGENLADAQAIVILAGGSYPGAPEYGGDTVSAYTLERVRWGARLHRLSGLPILVTGGNPSASRASEAAQMKAVLNEDFHVEVKWMEEKSLDTFENAYYTRQLLAGAKAKIDRIALVTHAMHMRRARLAFERAGFRVIEAPTSFSTAEPAGVLDYLPSAQALESSHAFLHEVLGLGWYHVRIAASKKQEGKQ